MRTGIKAALLQLHSIVGLGFALVLTLIAITGALMSFDDEISQSLDAAITRIEPRPAPLLTPDQLIARLQANGDLGKVSALTLTHDPAAVRVRFARNEDRSRPSALYVDPYDAHVLGAPRAEEFFATVRKLHRWLLLPGDAKGYGRPITGVITISLIVMLITGLVLRWPRQATSVKLWLKPGLALRGRGLHRSLHTVVGTWVLPVYLVMTLTGLVYSFDWYKDAATWLLSRPASVAATMPAKPPRSPDAAEAKPIGLERVWTAFQDTQGSRFATAQLTLPAGSGTMVRIRSWPRGASHDGARDEFRIDAATGQTLSSDIYAEKPLGERMLSSLLDIHRGSIFGWPGQLLFMLAAASMPLFAVTGLLLYLSRRKLRPAPQPTLGSLVPGE